MNSLNLHAVRQSLGWTQQETASRLSVSQSLVSMVENGQRSLTASLQRRLASYYKASPVYLPLREPVKLTNSDFAKELADLGYPGFAHRREKDNEDKASWNPAQLAVMGLSVDYLDRRVAEAFPWLLLRYWDADWNWAVQQLKMVDLQNRLGFVVTVARELAEKNGLGSLDHLQRLESQLERSRLVRQDTFCNERVTHAERKWLQTQSSSPAQHWNLLSDLRPEHLTHVA